MAITKIWNIAKSKDGNLSNSLHRSLLYIVNPAKTDGGVLVGGVNVMPDAELAYEQMCETKQIFGKELGRQGYHVVLSCPVGEGDPQTMYQSYLRLEFEPETNKDRETDPLHPAIPESPWEKERKDAEYKKRIDELLAKLHADEEARREKERKELEAEQERKRRLEAEKRHIKQEKKRWNTLRECFRHMMSMREKYSKNYESESELLVQEFKSVTLQQDDIDVDIIGQEKRILIDNVWALYYDI